MNYENTKILHKGKTYVLVPSEVEGMCQGCALYYLSCPPKITDLCTKGYILKRVIGKYGDKRPTFK